MVLADGTIRFTNIGDTVNWNSRNFFQGAGFWDVDLSVFKTFRVTESMNVRFTADFFNAFNTPMDPDPDSYLRTAGPRQTDQRSSDHSVLPAFQLVIEEGIENSEP